MTLPRRSKPTHWTLRSGDEIPERILTVHPEFHGIENNAAFRLMIFRLRSAFLFQFQSPISLLNVAIGVVGILCVDKVIATNREFLIGLYFLSLSSYMIFALIYLVKIDWIAKLIGQKRIKPVLSSLTHQDLVDIHLSGMTSLEIFHATLATRLRISDWRAFNGVQLTVILYILGYGLCFMFMGAGGGFLTFILMLMSMGLCPALSMKRHVYLFTLMLIQPIFDSAAALDPGLKAKCKLLAGLYSIIFFLSLLCSFTISELLPPRFPVATLISMGCFFVVGCIGWFFLIAFMRRHVGAFQAQRLRDIEFTLLKKLEAPAISIH